MGRTRSFFGIASLAVYAILMASCFQREANLPEEANLNIIPKPQVLKQSQGILALTKNWSIVSSEDLDDVKNDLASFLDSTLKMNRAINNQSKVSINLQIDKSEAYKTEAYQLVINEQGVILKSDSIIGIHRGIATLKQLILLNEYESNFYLPFTEIKDWAVFPHRGLLLDCSRHFFSVDVVKKYIDLLALYKMNTLHWHLTEDQGWRIAIDKYPNLTEIGAFRTELDGSIYGGFYTKEDIQEVVKYASQRNIEVIPEIELPGHSQAALAAYPYLSCTGDSINVANDWGVFKEIYCAGNDSVFLFLEDVLSEVIELFPSDKIHIGGDEAPKVRWQSCEKCQKRIKDEGLADEHELQSYFIRRIQKYLNQHKKELIGWDEIIEGGLAEGAIIQSWRGMNGGIEAVKHGNRAIMSPTSHAYLDYGLDAIDLKKVYEFYPIPIGLSVAEQELIIGGECNMWTEHVPDEKTLDSKVFPRMLAMAEVLWSDSLSRDFNEFSQRIQDHYPLLDRYQVEYGDEAIPMRHKMIMDERGAHLELEAYSEDISLNYQYHSSRFKDSIFNYTKPIAIDQSGEIIVQAHKNGKSYGDSIVIPVENHKGINAIIQYETTYSKWYTAGGDKGLTDGKLGTLNFRDGSWQGFWGDDLKCTIQLAKATPISSILTHFYQYNNSWIFIPLIMHVEISQDGTNWKALEHVARKSDPKRRGKFIESFELQLPETQEVTFIRLHVENIKKVPMWHEAAGSDAWIFIDEIIIE